LESSLHYDESVFFGLKIIGFFIQNFGNLNSIFLLLRVAKKNFPKTKKAQ